MTLTVPVDEIVARNSNGLLGKHETWERVRLGEVAKIQNGAAFKSEFFNREARGLPLLRIRDVLSNRTEAYYDGPFEDRLIVEPGALVIGMDGDFTCALWAGPRALLNQRVCRVDFKSDTLSKRFAFHALQGYLDAVNEVTSSVTVKHLSSRTVAELPLPLPPRAEQDLIVDRLEARTAELEVGILGLNQAERTLPRFQASILAAASTGRLTPSGGSSESGPELIDRILSERGSNRPAVEPDPPAGIELPPDWAWATVDQLARLVQYGSSSKTREVQEGVPVLRMGNITNGRLRLDELKYLPADHKEFPDLLLADGDVLFNRTNSPELVGKAAVYRGEPDPCSYASYLIRVRLSPHYRPELLVYYLNSTLGRAWIRSVVSQQVGQANVNGTKLRQLTVPVPPREQQDVICRLAEAQLRLADELRDVIAGTRPRAEQLQRAALEAAISGRLTRQDVPTHGAGQESETIAVAP